jgi:hypothetical protein
VSAVATPTGVERTGTTINHRRLYRVHLAFTDRDGTQQEAETGTTDGVRLAQARAHKLLRIVYDPLRPRVVRLEGAPASVFGLFVLLPIGFGLVGTVIFAGAVRRLARVRTIYIRGKPVQATITSVEPTSMRMNSRRVLRARYTFDLITGPVTGTTTDVTVPPVGATIWVLYDPEQPSRNVAA